MNFFSKHKLGTTIAGVIILSVILVACGSGGNVPSSVADAVDIISPPLEKNEGGITYTTRDLVGIDANGDGVNDATTKQLSALFGSQPAVLAAFMRSAKLDRDLLSIPDAKLPKTKAEADALIYAVSRLESACIEGKVLGDSNFEKETLQYYYVMFDTVAKRKRFQEIQELAGFQTSSFVSCDEITATSTK